MRLEILDRLWAEAEPKVYISKEAFINNLDGWEIEPVYIKGDLSFVTLTKGPAFHFQSFSTRKAISPRMIADFLAKIIAKHGYATTKTPKEDGRQHRFNLRFGFYVTCEDEYDIHYRIDQPMRTKNRIVQCHS